MWHRWLQVLIAALIIALPTNYVLSDYLITPGASNTVFAFSNGGKILPAHVLMNSTNVEIGTNANPVSIGVSSALSVNAAQATAANLNATVVGTGTFAVQAAQSGTWNIGTLTTVTNPVTVQTSIGNFPVTGTVAATQSGTWNVTTVTNPVTVQTSIGNFPVTGTLTAVTSVTNPVTVQTSIGNFPVTGSVAIAQGGNTATVATSGTDGFTNNTIGLNVYNLGRVWNGATWDRVAGNTSGAFVNLKDGNGNLISSTSNNLNVQCANCSGSGASAADQATFTAGASVFAPGGGFFQTTATSNPLTNGKQGMWQMTAQRAGFVNLRDSSGTEIATNASPITVQISSSTVPHVIVDSAVGIAQGSTTSGQTGSLVMGAVTTASPVYTNAQTSPLSLDVSGNMRINCITGCGGSGGTSAADESAFTAGSTSFTGTGGFFQTTATNNALTNGQWGAFQTTAQRALFTNLRNSSGTEIGTNANPVSIGVSSALAVTGSVNVGTLTTVTNPVTVQTSIGNFPVSGTVSAAQSGTWNIGTLTTITNPVTAQTSTGFFPVSQYVSNGGVPTAFVGDPCQTVSKTYTPIQISSTSTTRIIAPTSGKKTYICSMFLWANGSENVAVIEGTGGTCGTSPTGVIGGATPVSGIAVTAQAGFVLPNTGYAHAATAGSNVDFCLVTSSNQQLAGHAVWVQQ